MAEEGKDKAQEPVAAEAEGQKAEDAKDIKDAQAAEEPKAKAQDAAKDAKEAQAKAAESEEEAKAGAAEGAESVGAAPAAEEKTAEAPAAAAKEGAAAEVPAAAAKEETAAEEKKPLPKGSNPAPDVYYGTGRRKTAAARVFIRPGKGQFMVNGRPLREYFGRPVAQMVALQPLEAAKTKDSLDIRATVKGGGNSMQAQAIRHGLARALVARDYEGMQPLMRQSGWLTRDSRAVERKKVGLHKARKAPQYSKR